MALLKLIIGIALLNSACSTALITDNEPNSKTKPQQIHLSLGKSHAEMTVTWTTYQPTSTIVQYGLKKDNLNLSTIGNFTMFVDKGSRTHYIHRVRLVSLPLKTTFYYRCGSEDGEWSSNFQFKTLTDSSDWSPVMVVYGDLGVDYGDQVVPWLIREAERRTADVVFHNGDFAYDLGTHNSKQGDIFMRMIEPMATKVPFQTSIGNHETGEPDHYANYMNRFTMRDMIDEKQAENNVHFYRFFLGSALMISINNEIYINGSSYKTMKPEFRKEQEDWLKATLKQANTPEARKLHPWIIVLGHQPFYCHSSQVDTSCTGETALVRDTLEEILYNGGVDLIIGSHIHNYERHYPMYKGEVLVESYRTPYKNPKAPVNIVTGAGGAPELIDFQFFPRPPWNAFGNSQFGYGVIEVINATNLIYTQKAIVKNGTRQNEPLQIVDQVEIVQEHHGPWPKIL